MLRTPCLALVPVLALGTAALADDAATAAEAWAPVDAHLGDRDARAQDASGWTAEALRKIDAYVETWSARADEARLELTTAHMIACRLDRKERIEHHLEEARRHLAAATLADPDDPKANALLERYVMFRGLLLNQEANRKLAAKTTREREALVGQPAPALEIQEVLDGEVFTLASLRGDVVLVDFWATWCTPCRKAIPHLVELQREHAAAGLRVVGMTRFYRRAYVPGADGSKGEYLRKLDPEAERQANRDCGAALAIDYPIAFSATAHKAYHVRGIPQLVLIDRAGVVRHVQVGAGDTAELEAVLAKCLAEPAPQAEPGEVAPGAGGA